MPTVNAYAATAQAAPLEPFSYDLPDIGPDDVDVRVTHCGICHSDLSMLDNEWGMTRYPFVPGHEVAGLVEAVGERVPNLAPGDRVGVGWFTRSCLHCRQCLAGHHNLCRDPEQTIVGRHGGFADRIRAHWVWTMKLPHAIDPAGAGPLLCGGITVFNPILLNDIRPTDRVGVIGIGGLGHMALAFLNKWGCEVTAFTSSEAKIEEATRLGAHRCVNSRDDDAIQAEAGRHDMILSTANADMNWDRYLDALAPRGTLHIVGVPPGPVSLPAFPMIAGSKSVSGSPVGSPSTIAAMFDFCARHAIRPVTETFPMTRVNDALEHLRAGNARYRIVLSAAE